ncbi:MAG: transglycosylase domain-containing protein [Solirubrobacteraceae bacterium]
MSRSAPPPPAPPRRSPVPGSAWRRSAERSLASLRLAWRVRSRARRAKRARRPRMKRVRMIAIAIAMLALGLVSFAFGMFMAVTSDLPALESRSQYRDARNSVLLDDHGHPYAVLSKSNQVIVTPGQIPPIVKEAVIAIEDRRFYHNSGIDIRSMGRAVLHDLFGGGGLQGASTIEEQFVKNALDQQAHRTIFEKIKEAALAFHLDHRWSKEKIITEYLNTIYFGNGAYGIEAAARTYFGEEVNHRGCGTPQRLCVSELRAPEAALLAGIVQSPTDCNPVLHPHAARERRDLVLEQMKLQGYIDARTYREGVAEALPAPREVRPPREQIAENVDAGYFTNWVSQQVIARYGQNAFYGGLHVKTTLDLELQRAAERAVERYLSGPGLPTASLVAIENSTGDVRAMVGGRNYETSPFNIATEGERQPGSAFKAFDLAAALEDGISPNSVWASKEKRFPVPHSKEVFVVHNDEGAYTGTNTLAGALTVSDNSIFAEVGIEVGTRRIARVAHRMGITTPLSTNYAMTIGGLRIGVSPLEMAHAYETIAHGGQRVSGTLAAGAGEPVGIQEVASGTRTLPDGGHREANRTRLRRVLPAGIAQTETEMLEKVIAEGTGTAAAIGQFAAGKTGTTSNYVDAWFVGFDSRYTVAVWVGYPEGAKAMPTQFNGQPVYGGTYPALIWHDFMLSAYALEQQRHEGGAPAAATSGSTTAAQSATSGSGTTRGAPAPPAGGTSAGASTPGRGTSATGKVTTGAGTGGGGARTGAATGTGTSSAEAPPAGTPPAGGPGTREAAAPHVEAPAAARGEAAPATHAPQPQTPATQTPQPAAPQTPASSGATGGASAPGG